MFGDWMGEDAMKIWEGGQAMTKNRWYDEHFIKCNNCHEELIVYPYTDQKKFKCKFCGNRIKNKSYHLIIKKYKENGKKYF